MDLVDQSELLSVLAAVKHAQPVAFSALTEPKQRKCPHGRIFKLVRVQAFVGVDYEAAMNRKLEKQGLGAGFQAGNRQWGHKDGRALVENKGEYYLAAHIIKAGRPIYMIKAHEGAALEVIEKERIAQFLPEPSVQPVGYRNYALKSITQYSGQNRKLKIRRRSYASPPVLT